MLTRTLFTATLVLGATIAAPLHAAAPGQAWKVTHPARTHINHRIARQQVRITREVRQGDMTRREAHALRHEVHDVRRQERAYAQANGNNGHLTRAQVRNLNRELNRTSRRIGR